MAGIGQNPGIQRRFPAMAMTINTQFVCIFRNRALVKALNFVDMAMKIFKPILIASTLLITLISCRQNEKRFTLLEPGRTHIDFNNLIAESDTLNVLIFEYIYNGAGVGVGDFNNDGLQDIFFGGNMVSSKLYLNKGDFKFEDVTVPAGVETKLWCTGVALADVNQDGQLDIYISTVHPNENIRSRSHFSAGFDPCQTSKILCCTQGNPNR